MVTPRAAVLKHGRGAGALVGNRRDATSNGARAAPVRPGGGRQGFVPSTGDARAPVGLLPRSLAAFAFVVLDVGVALHFVGNFAREFLQIFLPPRGLLLLIEP